jgi:hypothetical protein
LVSDGVNLMFRPIMGLAVPVMNGAPTVNVEISLDGTNYYDLLDSDGATQAIGITAGAAAFMVSSDDLTPLAGYVAQYAEVAILVRLAVSATQTAEREFAWLTVG